MEKANVEKDPRRWVTELSMRFSLFRFGIRQTDYQNPFARSTFNAEVSPFSARNFSVTVAEYGNACHALKGSNGQ